MHTNLGSAKLLKLIASLVHHVRTYILIIYSLACKNDNIDILELVPVDLGIISLTFKPSTHFIPEKANTIPLLSSVLNLVLGAIVKLI
jgi:hypothetical protein